eukprot:TRINITY_DN1329_c0_g3_i2.p1 TRINITY_DN1329_c0_g3~~TRINITY_DN1329_c0_g3_i2.p1  ORF type:complete len:235 (+),score=86.89 TRINITY_DN1329_c0_g3_i2:60-707(+)
MSPSRCARDFVLHPSERAFLHGYKYAANAVNRFIAFPHLVLDLPLLRRALAHLLAAHTSLRFCYAQNDFGQWYRSIYGTAEAVAHSEHFIAEIDVSSSSAKSPRQTLRMVTSFSTELMREVLASIEDGGLLFRLALVQTLPEGERRPGRSGQIFVWIIHHLTHDGWTVNNVIFPALVRAYMQVRALALLHYPPRPFFSASSILHLAPPPLHSSSF